MSKVSRLQNSQYFCASPPRNVAIAKAKEENWSESESETVLRSIKFDYPKNK